MCSRSQTSSTVVSAVKSSAMLTARHRASDPLLNAQAAWRSRESPALPTQSTSSSSTPEPAIPRDAHAKRHRRREHSSAAADCRADKAPRRRAGFRCAATTCRSTRAGQPWARWRSRLHRCSKVWAACPAPACAPAPARAPAVARSLHRIVEISGNDGVLRAHHHAGRLQSHLRAMRAEVAFGGGAFVRIDVDGIVRASLHARFAADTALRTEIDDAVFALVHRRHGTDRHAGRILAMIAAGHLKNAARVGKRALLDVLHPGAIHREGNMILRLARHRAGVTADALAVVDDESVSHLEVFPCSCDASCARLGYCSGTSVPHESVESARASTRCSFYANLPERVRAEL